MEDDFTTRDDLPLPKTPTDALPGTPAKLVVMARRWQQGFALHHPDDAWADNNVAPLQPSIQRGDVRYRAPSAPTRIYPAPAGTRPPTESFLSA